MKKFLRRIAATVFIVFFLSSCATPWENIYTKEVRNSYPKFPECQKAVPEMRFDAPCYTSCMDYYYKRGKKDITVSAHCTEKCQKPTGRDELVDDYDCNISRAKQEGWFRK